MPPYTPQCLHLEGWLPPCCTHTSLILFSETFHVTLATNRPDHKLTGLEVTELYDDHSSQRSGKPGRLRHREGDTRDSVLVPQPQPSPSPAVRAEVRTQRCVHGVITADKNYETTHPWHPSIQLQENYSYQNALPYGKRYIIDHKDSP